MADGRERGVPWIAVIARDRRHREGRSASGTSAVPTSLDQKMGTHGDIPRRRMGTNGDEWHPPGGYSDLVIPVGWRVGRTSRASLSRMGSRKILESELSGKPLNLTT